MKFLAEDDAIDLPEAGWRAFRLGKREGGEGGWRCYTSSFRVMTKGRNYYVSCIEPSLDNPMPGCLIECLKD